MSRIGIRRSKNYPSCCKDSAYNDITVSNVLPNPKISSSNGNVFAQYYLILRRKPLFYTVNLVFPCVGISFLTIAVFYLPSYSGEKVSLCISILVALTVFFLLLIDLIPATSVTLPLIGKYLIFNMIMVTLSVLITVVSLGFHFRTPPAEIMPKWVRTVFLDWLPRMLFMERQLIGNDESLRGVSSRKAGELDGKIPLNYHEHRVSRDAPVDERIQKLYYSPQTEELQVVKAFENIVFIAEILKKNDRTDKLDEDWKYVAAVLDRFFLFIFAVACFTGTLYFLLQAPTLYDYRKPIDLQYRPAELNALFS
ncbi:unnamed protein product [Strongylus vulgaris]|uniref:Neurotransmitter-gated ion-channel transmembrane domain-containing protein n=1 Tax=Strongylus vulgaris TaxID=40348 RepID=A0A3P7K7P4_STRVU|nr:unnamed protein product [Strongylus vulgaris]